MASFNMSVGRYRSGAGFGTSRGTGSSSGLDVRSQRVERRQNNGRAEEQIHGGEVPRRLVNVQDTREAQEVCELMWLRCSDEGTRGKPVCNSLCL